MVAPPPNGKAPEVLTTSCDSRIKVANWSTARQLARHEYRVSWLDPVTAAWSGAAIELICPVLLVLGLSTRFAALPLLGLSLVIQLEYQALPEHL